MRSIVEWQVSEGVPWSFFIDSVKWSACFLDVVCFDARVHHRGASLECIADVLVLIVAHSLGKLTPVLHKIHHNCRRFWRKEINGHLQSTIRKRYAEKTDSL